MNQSLLFAVDIGGTLSKLAYIDNLPSSSDLDFPSSLGSVHLRVFENSELLSLISLMKSLGFNSETLSITGGGAFKYCSLFEEQLNTQVKKIDEIESLFKGFKTVMKEFKAPVFKFSFKEGKVSVHPMPLPSILCNIGSGVSICKIGESIKRTTGTCLGGGTALGLATMLLGVKSYDELLDLCKIGDADNVDLLYSDIDSSLDSTLAVSLGKLALDSSEKFRREDVAKSIIHMIAYNIGHVAYLAGKLEGINQICFAGNFLRGYEYIMDRISFAVTYWSKGTATALFMRHDGYFGAIGSLFEDFDIE
jgi:type II pantothenate kinase